VAKTLDLCEQLHVRSQQISSLILLFPDNNIQSLWLHTSSFSNETINSGLTTKLKYKAHSETRQAWERKCERLIASLLFPCYLQNPHGKVLQASTVGSGAHPKIPMHFMYF